MAPKTSPETGKPPMPPDSTVRVTMSSIPFFLVCLETISGRPMPILTISSTRSSLAALLPMILPAALFFDCIAETVSIFSFHMLQSS